MSRTLCSVLLVATVLASHSTSRAQSEGPAHPRRVAIEYRDLTGTQPMSSSPWVAHAKSFRLWEEGKPASLPVQELAENGNPEFILGTAVLDTTGVFGDAAVALPSRPDTGRRVELTVDAAHPLVSGGWMLGFTNDGFAGITSINAFELTKPLTVEVYALDAGTEQNTETKADTAALGSLGRIPENGVITRHPGLRGDADVPAAFRFDASKPAGRVTITPLL